MSFIGDLERFFATSLYPLRVPIAIGVIVGLIGLIVLARRRGWFAAARRHPGRSAALTVVILAIGLPLAWYLGSPLFIRTELVEPGPAAVAESAAPAPPSIATETPGTSASAGPSLDPASAPSAEAAFEPRVIATGTFQGADEFHFGEGTASIIETEPGTFTLRFEDFSVRNGPDLFVYLSPDASGYADGAVELGTLKATDGAFGYELPDGLDPTQFESAIIWCKQFAVLFAVAPFAPA